MIPTSEEEQTFVCGALGGCFSFHSLLRYRVHRPLACLFKMTTNLFILRSEESVPNSSSKTRYVCHQFFSKYWLIILLNFHEISLVRIIYILALVCVLHVPIAPVTKSLNSAPIYSDCNGYSSLVGSLCSSSSDQDLTFF